MDKPLKTPPPYAITSVDNALRIATMLQLEGPLTVTEVAQRLGVAGSTAHRLLAMLVYRDFAVRQADRSYRVGPVLELAAHSQSTTARLRAAALPHLHRLVDILDESANLTIRTGTTVRFIASVESRQALRVGSREGMVFPAHRTTAGLLLLAELPPDQLDELYTDHDLDTLRADLARVRRNGFALNEGRSERGVVAVGVPVTSPDGEAAAGLSISMPSARYEKHRLPTLVTTLRTVARSLEHDLKN
ncbi:IclR family transcriptional regulator [Actinomadura sp. WAC 06369]|uniref:IclR family transcriptional regulator n=1 Tax=Actinomadura sp. WAC 06369 TaxID=2203193 RepID=UPI000F7A2830|nr:IclR family transcriptional regulator [Actinomadura sp. WAC 06369]RSN64675.1 transcriptional regulator [Actinomadura sp. WAC 06369]